MGRYCNSHRNYWLALDACNVSINCGNVTMKANWANRTLFHGDNLPFLRAMNSESVDLIATDPPFNKGRDFHATPDSLAKGAKFQDRWSWEEDVHQDWIDQLHDDYPQLMEAIESAKYAHSDSMGAYLCFMAVRLLEMRRVLKPTGSIYLHCDPTASHYLKAAMDAIFGWRMFRNEVIWKKYGGHKNAAKNKFTTETDTILFYVKTNEYTFNRVYMPLSKELVKSEYKYTDDDGRRYSIPRGGSYRKGIIKKVYLDENPGKAVGSLWIQKGLTIQGRDNERTGYPTQKPLKLYERIIKASSNEGDIILDPFCGCATTLVAAEKLQRKWIGIDLWKGSGDLVHSRLHDTTGLFGNITFTDQLPERTDDAKPAVPYLRVKEIAHEPEGPRWTRKQMKEFLIEQGGMQCQGCNRIFDDERYLQLDHNTPRADGGINHISNRVLLCGPCNRLKAHRYTLSGLRWKNQKEGYMAK